MHRSRLAGFIIDCETSDLDRAAEFWGRALGIGLLGREGEAAGATAWEQED